MNGKQGQAEATHVWATDPQAAECGACGKTSAQWCSVCEACPHCEAQNACFSAAQFGELFAGSKYVPLLFRGCLPWPAHNQHANTYLRPWKHTYI